MNMDQEEAWIVSQVLLIITSQVQIY